MPDKQKEKTPTKEQNELILQVIADFFNTEIGNRLTPNSAFSLLAQVRSVMGLEPPKYVPAPRNKLSDAPNIEG